MSIVSNENSKFYVLDIFSPTTSLRECLADLGCASINTVHIPPTPFYLYTWFAQEQPKRGAEISINICSVSEFHEKQVDIFTLLPYIKNGAYLKTN